MSGDVVASYELFKVPPRWLFLRVETKRGVVGWGEPNVEGFSDTVRTAVEELMRSVVGQDPSRIQYIWQKLFRQKFYGGGPILMSAMAGIDQALWDIAGKTLGAPVSRLLGGAVRDRLKVYRWCGGDENSPEESAAEATRVLATSNYKQLKMNACSRMEYVDTEGVAAAAARFKAVREAVGPGVGVGLISTAAKLPMAKKLMEASRPTTLFFEEVLVRGQNPALHATVAHHTSVPLATGERMYTVEEFRDLLETRAVNILQPDCSHAGGISSLHTIARMAEAYEVSFAPHCPLGPIALAACLQVDATAVNFCFQETSLGIHYNGEGGMDLLDYVANKKAFDVDAEATSRRSRAGLGWKSTRRALPRWRATPGRTASGRSRTARRRRATTPGRRASARRATARPSAGCSRRTRGAARSRPRRRGRRAAGAPRARRGWQTTRHATHPTTDFSLHDAPHIWAVCAPIVAAVVLPALRAAFFAAGDPGAGAGLEVDDLFYVRYDADAPGAQTELEAHRDASLLSFSVAMSSPDDFVGGGTRFVGSGRVLRPEAAGDLVAHSGKVLHAGEAVTAGVRDILVGFVAVTGEAVNVNFLAAARHR
ncbi:mandelate racemase/muconate lactonizing enzyme [Aureococcus anophagefferens]|nr:mandelate racemase/muconate lactonizing enzyme [Aureococcus anophagefferens]